MHMTVFFLFSFFYFLSLFFFFQCQFLFSNVSFRGCPMILGNSPKASLGGSEKERNFLSFSLPPSLTKKCSVSGLPTDLFS